MGFTNRTVLGIPREDLNVAAFESNATFGFIGSRIFRPIEVGKAKGSFALIGVGEMLRVGDDTISKKGGYPEDDMEIGQVDFKLKRRGRQETFDEEDRENYSTLFAYEQTLINRARFVVEYNREKRIRDLCHDEATFDPNSGTTGGLTTAPWDQTEVSDPLKDIQDGCKALRNRLGIPAGRIGLQIPHDARWNISNAKKILDRIRYTRVPGLMSDQELAAALQIGEVTVGEAMANSKPKGIDANLDDLWNPNYAFLYVIPDQSLESPAVGRLFYKQALGGLGAAYQFDDMNSESMKYRWRAHTQENRYNIKAGYLIKGLITV